VTKEQLRAWRDRNFGSLHGTNAKAAEALGMTRRAFTDRLYGRQPIGRMMELACEAIDRKSTSE
jgi:hypothetical protein